MLNIDNYSLPDWLAKRSFEWCTHHKPPPRVPLASFGFQKPLANSGGNSCRVALRRSAFWRKRRFYFFAVSPEQNPNFFPTKSWFRILKKGLGRAKQFFWGFGFALPRLLYSARRRGLGRNAGGIRFTFLFGIRGGQCLCVLYYTL